MPVTTNAPTLYPHCSVSVVRIRDRNVSNRDCTTSLQHVLHINLHLCNMYGIETPGIVAFGHLFNVIGAIGL